MAPVRVMVSDLGVQIIRHLDYLKNGLTCSGKPDPFTMLGFGQLQLE
jgi:hypothetical protein